MKKYLMKLQEGIVAVRLMASAKKREKAAELVSDAKRELRESGDILKALSSDLSDKEKAIKENINIVNGELSENKDSLDSLNKVKL